MVVVMVVVMAREKDDPRLWGLIYLGPCVPVSPSSGP